MASDPTSRDALAPADPAPAPAPRPRRKTGPPPLTPYEDAFVDAYIGKAKFSAARAARIVGLSEKHAPKLLRKPAVRLAVKYRLRGGILPKEAIEAELSDVGGAEWRTGVKDPCDPEGKRTIEPVPVREKVKALEILARIRGLDRDPASVLLEKVMLRDLMAARLNGGPSAPRLTAGDAQAITEDGDDIVDAEVVAVDAALDEGAELAARAKAAEEERKAREAQVVNAPAADAALPGEGAAPAFPPLAERKL